MGARAGKRSEDKRREEEEKRREKRREEKRVLSALFCISRGA